MGFHFNLVLYTTNISSLKREECLVISRKSQIIRQGWVHNWWNTTQPRRRQIVLRQITS